MKIVCAILPFGMGVGIALMGAPVLAGIDGIAWRTVSPTTFDLFAVFDDSTVRVLGAELNAAPVVGDPTGLKSSSGVILPQTQAFLGGETLSTVVPLSITPNAGGSLLQGTWATLEGGASTGPIQLDSGVSDGVRLLRVVVDPGTLLGSHGSSIQIGFTDDGVALDQRFEIPGIPTPGAGVLFGATLGAVACRRRRR